MSLLSLAFQGGLNKDLQKCFEHKFIVGDGFKELLGAASGPFSFTLPG